VQGCPLFPKSSITRKELRCHRKHKRWERKSKGENRKDISLAFAKANPGLEEVQKWVDG